MSGMILLRLLAQRSSLSLQCIFPLLFGAITQVAGVTAIDVPVLGKLYSVLFFSRGSLALGCFIAGCIGFLFKEFTHVDSSASPGCVR
jgi:hypothetical protein